MSIPAHAHAIFESRFCEAVEPICFQSANVTRVKASCFLQAKFYCSFVKKKNQYLQTQLQLHFWLGNVRIWCDVFVFLKMSFLMYPLLFLWILRCTVRQTGLDI